MTEEEYRSVVRRCLWRENGKIYRRFDVGSVASRPPIELKIIHRQ